MFVVQITDEAEEQLASTKVVEVSDHREGV